MKQYDKYKPTGIDWLGDIPEHWVVRRVKELLVYDKGCTPESNNSRYYDDEDYEWATISDIREDSKYLEKTASYVSQYAVNELGMVQSPKGSLLYSFKLSIGKVAFLNRNMFTNEAILSIFPTKTQNLNFWYFALPYYLKYAAKENIYGAPMLNDKLINNAIIPAFSIPEQTAIADYLDEKTSNIDRRIELLKQKIDKYKELRRSLISQVVTRGLNPNVKLKPSGIDWLGDIPEHWKLRRIKDVIKLINGRAYSQDELLYEGKYKVLRVGNFFTNESWYYSNLELEKEKYCHKNDLLYAWSASIGPYIWTEDNTIFHYHIWKVDLNNKFTLKYAYYLLLAVTKRKMFDMHGSAMVHLTMEDMNYTFIPFPNITEQTAIADYLDEKTSQIDTIVSNCEKQIEQLTELRRSLISQVVTGKIKVTD